LETVLETYTGDRNTPGVPSISSIRKAGVFQQRHSSSLCRKKKSFRNVRPSYIESLLQESECEEEDIERLTDIMCNPNTYKVRRNTGKDGDILLTSSTNLYSGVTRKQAEAFYAGLEDPSDANPVEHAA